MSSKIFMSVFVPWSIILPILIGLIQLKKMPYTGKIIWYYLLVAAVVNFAATYIGRSLHKNNLPLIHIYTLVEMVFFIWFYKHLFKAPKQNKLYIILPIAFAALCSINALFFQSIFTYSSYTRSLEAIICILFALKYFAHLATNSKSEKIILLPTFYFNAGIFLYFSAAFMLFVFSNFIFKLAQSSYYIIWVMHGGFLICMYLFFTAGFIVCKK